MTPEAAFLAEARDSYVAANAAALDWLLGRPQLSGPFLNTKMNSLTLTDYGAEDGPRGPDYTYGWIQGRGLEALITHAAYFEHADPGLAEALDARARGLYRALAELQAADGHAYFCYDRALAPIRFEAGAPVAQSRPAEVFTYSDAFIAKGLVAAAARFAPDELEGRLAYLESVIAAIEAGRFQMDEAVPLSAEATAAEPDDFGPRMILIGAAGLLARIGESEKAGFADRFIAHVLDRHLDRSGLLVNVPGEDSCNVGHGIEFVGFALEHLRGSAPGPDLAATLEDVLVASFRRGFAEPGIALSVSIRTGAPLSRYCPWWSLPEAIRAAALCHEQSGSSASLSVWRRAHQAFFNRYWRGVPPIAYQTLTKGGPVDYVPATPDLDPGYHTGLSLLAAIEVVERNALYRRG